VRVSNAGGEIKQLLWQLLQLRQCFASSSSRRRPASR